MKEEETIEQKRVRELSEKNNPYSNECPNRHLWSEGFRSGYNFENEEILKFVQSQSTSKLTERENILIRLTSNYIRKLWKQSK